MQPTAKIEFPNGRPWLYVLMWIFVACAFIANWVIWYWIPKYSSKSIADATHPLAIRFNGVVFYASKFSSWLFEGSFIVLLIAIVLLVGLSMYYRSIGVAIPVRNEMGEDLRN